MKVASGWPACYDALFARLDKVINAGPGRWKAMCPCHPDKVQSLSVRVGNRGALWVRCHAGGLCKVEAIVRALGLTMDDLFPDNRRHTGANKPERKSIVDTVYQYQDENGAVLFEAIRKEPKAFRQRRPNPEFNPTLPPGKDNPEYLYNLEGVRRVLYRLPYLIASLARTPDKAVLILEGEKDVDNAVKAGFIATTNPMGAGKWSAEYNDYLKGANVVVIPDNDEPGKAHAKAVCESLKGVARTVRYVELPGLGEKEDFTDWFHKVAKGTADQKRDAFKKLVSQTTIYGTDQKSAPKVNPAGSVPEAPKPAPVPPKDETPPPAPEPVPNPDPVPPKPRPEPASPTIRGAEGLPVPDPRTIPAAPERPKLVDVDPPPAPAPVVPPPKPEPGPLSHDPKARAERVASFVKDAKTTAAALKNVGAKCSSHMEFYGNIRQAVAQLDAAVSLSNGLPKLDRDVFGQVALLLAAHLLTAAADQGIGCGLIPDEPPVDAIPKEAAK